MSDKEAAAYKRGYTCGFVEARIEAFGAIRRAVEWARSADKHGGPSNAARAALVRHAIRAAIGSDKT